MSRFDGLHLDVAEGNVIDIDDDCVFKASKILIKGHGNHVKICKSLYYKSLVINISGNNKSIKIEKSKKHISNLKIVSIRGDHQLIEFGQDFSCGGLEVQMNDGFESLSIGSDCLFSWGIKMRTSDGHSVIDLSSGSAVNLPRNIKIGDHVWVGEDVKFLKGAEVSSNSIVASYSVLTKAFENENIIIAGFPARVVKENVTWHREMPRLYNEKRSK